MSLKRKAALTPEISEDISIELYEPVNDTVIPQFEIDTDAHPNLEDQLDAAETDPFVSQIQNVKSWKEEFASAGIL